MPGRASLVVVSNRGPVGFRRGQDGSLEAQRGAGGLVTALRPLVDRHDVTWVASAMSDADRELVIQGARRERSGAGSPFRLRFVAHDPDVYRLFYAVVANPVLWFVQHGLWELKRDPDADLERPWREGYVEANRALAAAAVQELDRLPGAPLFVNDYHLYLVPALVRAARPEARIAHFVHIPWVGPDGWSVLPAAIPRAIHEALLECDSVGFHTERWRAAFVESCDALLGRGADAERCSHVNPIAVDAQEFDALAAGEGVRTRRAALEAERPEILVLRVDRVDPSKNAVRGFEAFGLLLERTPSLHGRAGLLALLDPSREEIPEYVDYRSAVERSAADVNERFGRPDWTPVTLDVRDDFLASVAAYTEYDVLLVNPVMDGLNLIAKEAPLVNARDGVVVLSRDAGAFEELAEWVVGIDPLDVGGQAEALRRAIELPAAERRAWLARIRGHVRTHDLESWASRELLELDSRAPLRAR
ncbi:MAG TPA: trehalose-6-phosphate synthase [Gaiella sp.]|jgi:trehalose 6-phosphate synthase|nr:trehalose-6-phosphate synthase [Gaiella sp.]